MRSATTSPAQPSPKAKRSRSPSRCLARRTASPPTSPRAAVARDVDALVASLTLDEKAALLAGADLWSTVAVERVGIAKVFVTDGPNGARGPALPGTDAATTSWCAPCGSALGATWNVDLVERVGRTIGGEASTKASRLLLAPTVSLQRTTL